MPTKGQKESKAEACCYEVLPGFEPEYWVENRRYERKGIEYQPRKPQESAKT